jgi:hypothetical protein
VAEKKLVRATMKETLMSDLGRLARGVSYEIPEARFTAWEKAGLCSKADGKSDGGKQDGDGKNDTEADGKSGGKK